MNHMALALMAFTLLLSTFSLADSAKPKLDSADRESAINNLIRCLNENYTYPNLAKKMEAAIRERAAKKEYDKIEDGNKLAETLTRDLRAVSNDLHLSVHYSAEVLPPQPTPSVAPNAEQMEQMRYALGKENYGFPRVEVLKGNIGYIECRYFAPLEIAADTYIAAMNYVANTEALILDLRGSMGSMSPDTLPMICGYFFEKPVHLGDLKWRFEDTVRQYWSAANVSGKRYLNKPIYILTSGATFSGAEGLAYDLKNLKRATVIGEVTGGGANPGFTRRVDDHFTAFVPCGQAINAVTKTNWEGVGVKPDIEVPAARALIVAQQHALKQMIATTKDDGWKEAMQSALKEVDQKQARVKKIAFTLKGYPDAKQVNVAGTFNYWSRRANPLTRKGDAWVGEVEVEPGRHMYKFVVDSVWITDPANPEVEKNDNRNSIRLVE